MATSTWCSPPTTYTVLTGFGTLSFVPCRSLPRNVILQQRSRVLANGEVEDYENNQE